MKSMRPPLAAIFFMTYFHRARGAMVPSGPPLDPLLCNDDDTLTDVYVARYYSHQSMADPCFLVEGITRVRIHDFAKGGSGGSSGGSGRET